MGQMNQNGVFVTRQGHKPWFFISLLLALCSTLILTGCQETGSTIPPTQTSQAPESVYRIVVVGDSLSTGLGTTAQDAWPNLINSSPLTESINLAITNEAQNSSGYLAVGSKNSTFETQVKEGAKPDTDMVLIFGSENDRGQDPQALEAAVTKTLALARAQAPHATVVMVGPPAYIANAEPNRLAVRNALKSAAESAHVDFIDPITEGWIFGDVDRLVGPDGVHPSVEGQHDLQEKMEAIIVAALMPVPAAVGG